MIFSKNDIDQEIKYKRFWLSMPNTFQVLQQGPGKMEAIHEITMRLLE